MLNWLLSVTEVNRLINLNYIAGSFIFTAIFITILALYKRKKELVVGFIAGLLMLITELILWSTGLRIVDSPINPIIVLVAIGFNPMFFVGSVCYSAIIWFYKKIKDAYYKLILSYFVLGYIGFSLLAMFVVPAFGDVIVRRLMFNGLYLLEVLLAMGFFAINYWLLGLKKLTKIAFAVGVLINFIIEGTMVLVGIRWYVGTAWIKFFGHILFELNAGIMMGIFTMHKLGLLERFVKQTK